MTARHTPPTPAPLDTQGLALERFWRLARAGTLIAIGVHGVFAIAGWVMNAPLLVIIQAISIAVYTVNYLFASHAHRWLAIGLAWADLLVHATVAGWILGVDSGFQYYSWILLPLVFTNVYRSSQAKIALAVLLCAFYLAVDWWLHRTPPLVSVDPDALAALRAFNIGCYLLALGVIAVAHGYTVASAEQRLNALASTDMLTGLLNRRRMTDHLQKELTAARAADRPLSVLLLDIDHFKSINDQFGHGRGDQVIVAVGEVLRATVRREDLVARWGGEEFLIVQPNSVLGAARETAERIRRAVAACVVRDDSEPTPVTVTIGVACWRPGESLDETIHRADAALYLGKRSGKNRVIVDDGTTSPPPLQAIA